MHRYCSHVFWELATVSVTTMRLAENWPGGRPLWTGVTSWVLISWLQHFMPALITGLLGLSSLLAVLLFFLAGLDVSKDLSPQGCRMSWMSPSYIIQTGFDSTWTPLARRYSLWLYREVGWDSVQVCYGGNCSTSINPRFRSLTREPTVCPFFSYQGTRDQLVRSAPSRLHLPDSTFLPLTLFLTILSRVASSPWTSSRVCKHSVANFATEDVSLVEFNEDLSAFHGSTLQSQIMYTSRAISYILSLYPANTKIIVMGHSMGGIVATSLLPCSNISAIITMSTPHALPPARFDSRIDSLYDRLQVTMDEDRTPIVSLCGGALDIMINSETCILSQPSKDVYRKTIFTTALEGAWTGVRHDGVVWCHQVRWRVARAALELGFADDLPSRARVLDRWLRDGRSLPPSVGENEMLDLSDISNIDLLPSGQTLLLNNPPRTKTVLLPVLYDSVTSVPLRLTVLVSQGSIPPVSPQTPIPLKVSIFHCVGGTVLSATCKVLPAESLKLVPNPIPGTIFPVPHEGSDESEGVVLYEARIPYFSRRSEYRWIGIKVENGDGRGWVAAGLDHAKPTIVDIGTFCMSLIFSRNFCLLNCPNSFIIQKTIRISRSSRRTHVRFLISELRVECLGSLQNKPTSLNDAFLLWSVFCQKCCSQPADRCYSFLDAAPTGAYTPPLRNSLFPTFIRIASSNPASYTS